MASITSAVTSMMLSHDEHELQAMLDLPSPVDQVDHSFQAFAEQQSNKIPPRYFTYEGSSFFIFSMSTWLVCVHFV
jgi:hypothetical protein